MQYPSRQIAERLFWSSEFGRALAPLVHELLSVQSRHQDTTDRRPSHDHEYASAHGDRAGVENFQAQT
jgi:hypothetical protein